MNTRKKERPTSTLPLPSPSVDTVLDSCLQVPVELRREIIRNYLLKWSKAAEKAVETAKLNAEGTDRAELWGQLMYWSDVSSAIDWLMHHLDHLK